jgi:superfamily II DNA or RNA helicase
MTVIGAWMIARQGVNTLVLAHRPQLLDQWIERLSNLLGLSAQDISRIGGDRCRPTGRLRARSCATLVSSLAASSAGSRGYRRW